MVNLQRKVHGGKGFTIVELMVYLSLSALLLGVMGLFLKSVLGQYVFYGERISIQKIGSLLTHKLERDIEVSTIEGVLAESETTTLVQSFSSVDATGHMVWADSVVIYRFYPGAKEVKRWVVEASSVTSTPVDFSDAHAFTVTEAEEVPDPLSGEQVRTWGHVEKFSVERVMGEPMLSVSLELRLVDTKEHEHRHSLEQILLLRNDGEIS